MALSARKQFPNWIQKAGFGIDVQAITLHNTAIDEIIEEESPTFWLDLVKLALGVRVSGQNINSFVEAFTSKDPSFPLVDNQNLLRHLACSTLAIFVNESESEMASKVALSITTTVFLGQYNLSDVPYVGEYAKLRMRVDSISIRSNDLSGAETDLKNLEETYEEVTGEEPANFINDEMNNILAVVRTTLAAAKALKEELNVHWWLFGEYMDVADEIFSNIPAERMAFLSALELSKQTVFKIPLLNSEQYLRKALFSSKIKKKVTPISIHQGIALLASYDKEEILTTIREKVSYQTPLLLAIKCSQDVVDDDWSPQFKALSNQGDPKKEFSLWHIANQLYNELILLKLA